MKKDRNCGMGMPIYPGYMPNMMPGIPSMNMKMISLDGSSKKRNGMVEFLILKDRKFKKHGKPCSFYLLLNTGQKASSP